MDGWNAEGDRFLFGIDAMPNLVQIAENLPKSAGKPLTRQAKYEVKTEPRQRPENVKERTVVEKGYENLKLQSEEVGEFAYRPTVCTKAYRVAVVRKNLSVEKGERVLFDDLKYFFYLTNDKVSPCDTLVAEANGRCNQENLIAQLKNAVFALRMPVDNLVSPGAPGGVHGDGLAGLDAEGLVCPGAPGLLPDEGRRKEKYQREKQSRLSMEFKKFVNAFVRMPALVVRAGRRLVFRLLSRNPWQEVFLRGVDILRGRSSLCRPRRC